MNRAFVKPFGIDRRGCRSCVIDDRSWRRDPDRFDVLHVLHVLFLESKFLSKKWAAHP
jgi:hypothetical protein